MSFRTFSSQSRCFLKAITSPLVLGVGPRAACSYQDSTVSSNPANKNAPLSWRWQGLHLLRRLCHPATSRASAASPCDKEQRHFLLLPDVDRGGPKYLLALPDLRRRGRKRGLHGALMGPCMNRNNKDYVGCPADSTSPRISLPVTVRNGYLLSLRKALSQWR